MSRYQKGKTNLDFTEARDSEWQWHRLGRMQVCHASTSTFSFLQAGCPSCRPTNSVKAPKALLLYYWANKMMMMMIVHTRAMWGRRPHLFMLVLTVSL